MMYKPIYIPYSDSEPLGIEKTLFKTEKEAWKAIYRKIYGKNYQN